MVIKILKNKAVLIPISIAITCSMLLYTALSWEQCKKLNEAKIRLLAESSICIYLANYYCPDFYNTGYNLGYDKDWIYKKLNWDSIKILDYKITPTINKGIYLVDCDGYFSVFHRKFQGSLYSSKNRKYIFHSRGIYGYNNHGFFLVSHRENGIYSGEYITDFKDFFDNSWKNLIFFESSEVK